MIESKGLAASLHCLPTLLASHASTRPLADRAQSLHARLSSGRFHLAVLGQFKRGKSTLLNALLGEPFLPTGVVPVTAIPTLIEYGPARQARIIFHESAARTVGLEELAAYVTEAANPHNELGVARVEVQHPAPLLAAYAQQADALVDDLRRLAAGLFAFNFVPLNPDEPPARLRVPYWARSALTSGLGMAIAPGVWERWLRPAKRRQRILNRVQPLAERVAARNTENLRWAVVQNSEQVMRQFQSHLDERWAETIEATAAVLDTAVARREQHAEEIAGSLHELDQAIHELEALAQELPGA